MWKSEILKKGLEVKDNLQQVLTYIRKMLKFQMCWVMRTVQPRGVFEGPAWKTIFQLYSLGVPARMKK